MATSIVNPGASFGADPFAQINQATSLVRGLFNPNAYGGGYGGGFGGPLFGGAGGGPGPYGLAPQRMSGNDLTRAQRSLTNLAGTSAAGLLGAGENILGTGMGVTGAGLDVTGGGLAALQAPLAFYQQLLTPGGFTRALAPTAANLSQVTSGLLNQLNQSPRGGWGATEAANLPYSQLGQLTNAALALQPMAAQGEAALGGEIAGIGQGMAGTGLQLGGLGSTLAGMGQQGLQNVIADVLQKMGINIQGGTAMLGSQIVNAIGSLLGGGGRLGEAIKTCWIAEAIYGIDDMRTHLIRAYLNGPFKQTLRGRFIMSLYLWFGEAVAAKVRKHEWLKSALRPVFGRALESAVKWGLKRDKR